MQRLTRHLLALFILACAAMLYFPGIRGDFLFDDSINILDNPSLHLPDLSLNYLIEAAFSNPAAAGQRWLAMLSLALNQYFLGPTPEGFKIINIAIHGLCGLCVYWLTGLLTGLVNGRTRAPGNVHFFLQLLVAIAWLITPINLSPVLYIVQRMTSLSALFVLACLSTWILFRQSLDDQHPARATLWLAICGTCAVLAVSCKENGVLIPAYLLLLEALVIGPHLANTRLSTFIARALTACLLAAAAVFFTWWLMNPGWLSDAYLLRDFTPVQRVLTQGRVLWFYALMTFAPQNQRLGLYHDDWITSTSWWEPVTTLPAWLAWVILAGIAIRARAKYPIACFGVLFFLLAHSMEASFLSLEMMHEHRNYLPSAGLLIAAVALIPPATFEQYRKGALTLCSIYLALLATLLCMRVSVWSNLVDHAQAEITYHPHSDRSLYQWARVQLMLAESSGEERFRDGARVSFEQLARRSPDTLEGGAALIIMELSHPSNNGNLPEQLDAFIAGLRQTRLHPALLGKMHPLLDHCRQNTICRSRIDEMNEAFMANATANQRFRAMWLSQMATAAESSGDIQKASNLLEQAISTDPGSRDIQRSAAIYHLQQGHLDRAEELFSRLNSGIYGFANPGIGHFLTLTRQLKSGQTSSESGSAPSGVMDSTARESPSPR